MERACLMGATRSKARAHVADFCSASMAGFCSAVDNLVIFASLMVFLALRPQGLMGKPWG